MALIGTISGSNGTSTTAISGSLIIANRPASTFPSLPSGVTFYVSGTKTNNGSDQPSGMFTGDVFHSGALGTDTYMQFKPVGTLPIPTNTTASYIYTSGSSNDLYFTQYNGVYTNTTRLRWLEGEISTGLLAGGTLSSTSGSNTYNILSGSGLIVNFNAGVAIEPYPVITRVSWPTLTGQSLPSISTTQITYVAMDSTGTPYLKSIPFTDGDYNNYIVLGRILHTDKAGTNGAVNQPLVSYGTNQFRGDFIRAFGPIKLSGHTFYASGTQGIKKDAGDSYAEGRNYTVDPNNPNYVSSTTDTAQNTSKIFYEYVNSAGDDVILNNGNVGYSALDFAQYNNGGTLTTVGTGNKFTIQRVYWFPNAVNRAFYVYYGNTIYSTLDSAQAGISTEVFTEGKNTRDAAIFLGYAIVKGTGLDFTDTTTYRIVQAGSFRAVASSGAGASGTPGGSDTQVQFNDSSVFNGTSDFRFIKTTATALLANLVLTGSGRSLVSSGTLRVVDGAGAVVGSISTAGVISGSSDLQIGGNITGSNVLLSGDLAVNGGDITTTATTFNLLADASTALNIGNSSATNTVSGQTTFPQGVTGSLRARTIDFGSSNAILTASNSGENLIMSASNLFMTASIYQTGSLTVQHTTGYGLTVQNADGTSALQMKAKTGGFNSDFYQGNFGSDLWTFSFRGADKSFLFYSYDGVTFTNSMRLHRYGGVGIGNAAATISSIGNNVIYTTQYVGVSILSPTSRLHIAGGSEAAGAALRIESGSLISSPLSGNIEFNGTNLFITSGTTRQTILTTLTNNSAVTSSFLVSTVSDMTMRVPGAAGDTVRSIIMTTDRTPTPTVGTDTFLFVSGSTSSKGTSTRGTAVFGGDVVISGNIYGGVQFGSSTGITLQATKVSVTANSLSFGQSGGTDTAFFVSGSSGGKNTSGTSLFGGDVVISGTLYNGAGVAYTAAAVTGTFNDVSAGLVTTASVSFAGTQGAAYFASRSVGSSTGGDVFFYVSGTARSGHSPAGGFLAKRTLFNGDVVTSGTLQLLGAGYTGAIGSDTLLFVSGGIGTKGTSFSRGTTVFAGDLLTSGALHMGTAVELMGLTSSIGAGTSTFDVSQQSIFYVSGATSDFTANFTNVPTISGRVVSVNLLVTQSATAYKPTAVQIGGVAQTLLWSNGVTPTANANKQDVFGFSLVRSGSIWAVLGQMSTYG